MDNFESYSIHLPPEKGNYILIFQLEEKIKLKVGALQKQSFLPDNYVYAGSALGPGGIRARVKHHLTPSPKPHWHMDYLKPYIQWLVVGWKVTTERLECHWTQQLAIVANMQFPAAGFGASDCQQGCPAHLLQTELDPDAILKILKLNDHIDFMYNKANF